MMAGGYQDGSAGYTFSADIWSVGCVVIGKQELLILPFETNRVKHFL